MYLSARQMSLLSQVRKQLAQFSRWLSTPTKPAIQGSQRPLASYGQGSFRKRYDLEIIDNPVRDAAMAREFIELLEWNYECRFTCSMAADDVFASADGDIQGFHIPEMIEPKDSPTQTPVNPELLVIANDLIQRKESHECFVIGGDKLKKAIRWGLAYGDCFLELGIEKEGIGRNDYGISRSLYLPTWEVFRNETDQGYLIGFDQRRYLSYKDPDYTFVPPQIIHFRHEDKYLYGESLWKQSLKDWGKLKEAVENLADAARDLGINPNLHIMFEGATPDDYELYKRNNEINKLEGIQTDYYLYHNQDIRKLSGVNPNLQPLIDNLMQCRYRMIPAGIPTYFFSGLQQQGGTKDLSREPARKYARLRYSWCQMLAKGIRQAIDTEIVLKKGWDWYVENAQNKYRIEFPAWVIDGMNDGGGTLDGKSKTIPDAGNRNDNDARKD